MRISDWSSDVCSSDLDFVPDTICDGLRGTLGAPDFALLREYRVEVLTVEDADTIAAMRLLWQRMKLLVEPSSAIALAMVLGNRERFAGQRVGVVLSGGNVDLDALPWRTPAARRVGQEGASTCRSRGWPQP